LLQRGDLAIAQAIACSRPPLPNTTMFIDASSFKQVF
jgi:hypothetical protein